MTKHHFQIAVLVGGALFMQVASLHDWSEAITPTFVGGTGLAVVAVLKALFTEKPGR